MAHRENTADREGKDQTIGRHLKQNERGGRGKISIALTHQSPIPTWKDEGEGAGQFLRRGEE